MDNLPDSNGADNLEALGTKWQTVKVSDRLVKVLII